jgi:1,4-alpha-glucan branching enzyme
VLGGECPQAITLAEESTAFPAVSRPTYAGGLGFHFKWNMGWMHDTLKYMARDPVHRSHHQGELTFGLVYAFSENFVLPLSHDEVVHGKGFAAGQDARRPLAALANLRAYYGFMWATRARSCCSWAASSRSCASGTTTPAWTGTCCKTLRTPACSAWCATSTADRAARRCTSRTSARRLRVDHARRCRPQPAGLRAPWADGSAPVLVLCNFAPVVHRGLRVGVPRAGRWVERLNTDSAHYGGSNVGTPLGAAQSAPVACHGRSTPSSSTCRRWPR